MGFVNKASFIPAVLVVFLTGCALTQPTSSTAQKEHKTQLIPFRIKIKSTLSIPDYISSSLAPVLK